MEGNLNAFGILAILAVTLWIVLRYRRHDVVWKRTMWGVVYLVLALKFCPISHLCNAGEPCSQWIIPVLCATAVVTLVSPKWLRWVTIAVWFLSAFLLCQHYHKLVHSPDYTGNPGWGERFNKIMDEKDIQAIQVALEEASTSDMENYPSGWMDHSGLKERIPEQCQDGQRHRDAFVSLWHSGLTGLYGKRSVAVGVWWPGGTIKEAVGRVEIRPRNSSEAR